MTPEKDRSEGCKKWDPTQRLRRAQLDDKDNRYNTYTHEGLPPGPICSPGYEALVVDPFYTNYSAFAAMAGIRLVPHTARGEDGFHLPPREKWDDRLPYLIGHRSRSSDLQSALDEPVMLPTTAKGV